jgi:hypothetical protein
MALLVMLVTCAVWVWLVDRLLHADPASGQHARAVDAADAPLSTAPARRFPRPEPPRRRAVPSVRQECPSWPLGEDEVIDFGRALECSDDVVAKLIASS